MTVDVVESQGEPKHLEKKKIALVLGGVKNGLSALTKAALQAQCLL